jgi:hypothetical protein
MINGFQCGQSVTLTQQHLTLAKDALMRSSFVGLQEHFAASVCLFQWTLGGAEVEERHFKTSRVGNYTRLTIQEALTPSERLKFQFSERFDIELYAFAKNLVMQRLGISGIDPNLKNNFINKI